MNHTDSMGGFHMYHCHINFFFLGGQRRLFQLLEEMPPLEHFTHDYFESRMPYETMISKADVIIADLNDMDAAATVKTLLSSKRHDAELIVQIGRASCRERV